jgi:hypothetical protein
VAVQSARQWLEERQQLLRRAKGQAA